MTTRQFLVKLTGAGYTLVFNMFFSVVNGQQITLMSINLISFTFDEEESTLPADFVARSGKNSIDNKQDLTHFINWKNQGTTGSTTLFQEGLTYTNIEEVTQLFIDNLQYIAWVGEEVIDGDTGDKMMVEILNEISENATTTTTTLGGD